MGCQRNLGAYYPGLGVLLACLFLLGSTLAQSSGQTQPSAPASSPSSSGEGKEIGGFQVTQSIEIGGRISEVTGSQPMYDTLLNLQSGARILEQSLTMRSLTHEDIFDTLTLNSFGWGGDPEQAARLRMAKYRWYNFSFSYQHMQNYFDYDLFANPLNPPTGSPFIPILNSPHTYYDRQNLYNFDLVLLPMHRVSFRVDYNRNRIIGPSLSSVHQGTDALTNQDWNNTLNGWRFGADWRVNKKTTLSYTQMLQYYFGGPTYGLNNFNSWPLPNGTPVTFGLPWFNSGSPCAAPLKNGIANPSCNGYFTYGLDQHVSTFIPTEQINLKSSSLKWLDFTGQYQYSHASSSTPLNETFTGLISRTNNLGFNTSGSNSNSRWNTSSADVSATFHINDQIRLVETFRFRNFSVAGQFLDLTSNYFTAASAKSATLLTPIATFPPTILLHSSGSPADIINETNINLIGQNMKQNDFQLQYDITHFFGIRVGFNWTQYIIQPGSTYQAALGDIYYPNNPNRGNCVGLPLNPDGSCTFTGVITPFGNPTTTINRYSGVLGAWFRKGSTFHANINAEVGGADNWIYRTDPTTFFNVTGNVSYAPRPWLTVGGNLIFQQSKNNTPDINFNQHNYSAVVNATIMPNTRWGLDLGYNFDALQQNIFLCFQDSTPPPGSSPCLGDNTLLQTYGIYQTHTQYGYFALTLTPIERVTMRLGYNIVDNQGTTTSFNSLLPLGPLSSTYQSPLAAVDVNVYKTVTFEAGYNYYQYSEGSFVGPTAPRYFHANNTTLALKYAF
ncbi:MAG TPA: hypothetical protein VKG65_00080 [Terriglobales bacterium]|nr:hypothetical protein [Terriglobales bacterium]